VDDDVLTGMSGSRRDQPSELMDSLKDAEAIVREQQPIDAECGSVGSKGGGVSRRPDSSRQAADRQGAAQRL
jgi:hypothetical protein